MKNNDQRVPTPTRHDPAMREDLGDQFAAGAADTTPMKGSQGAYQRRSFDRAIGSAKGQPAQHGQFPHPIPPPKGDRR